MSLIYKKNKFLDIVEKIETINLMLMTKGYGEKETTQL